MERGIVFMTDIYDGAECTAFDIEDLKASIEHGSSIEEASSLICRFGSIDDVQRKANELGLHQRPSYSNMFGERYSR
jgi:hypothetical protein